MSDDEGEDSEPDDDESDEEDEDDGDEEKEKVNDEKIKSEQVWANDTISYELRYSFSSKLLKMKTHWRTLRREVKIV